MNERSIFLEALEKSTLAQRSAYLDEVCASETALRQRVEALLKSHVEVGSFLGEPVPERLAGQMSPAGGEATVGVPTPDGAGLSLNFLTASDKPDSLGRLGSYEVQEVIGRGGMGIVLRAFDEKLHRVVAIKVMTAPLATNATARQRFTREARSAAAVSHDHVVTIHGVEETSDLPYLVMQYVSGVSLQERLDKNGPLQLHEILRIGMQAATGLAAAHAQGLVHRDIKPSNILLENGVERVKITDFGLAHAVDDVRTTQPGTVIGTPEYMSPEQARGERVDHRSDLFSLGCVLYAMCAGRPPFRAESTVAIIHRVCDDTPRPLVEINPEIPEWLVNLIDKLIAKDASERFQSAAEVAELLSQYLAHVQQPAVNPKPAAIAKPQPVHCQTSRHARRRWSIAAAAVLLLGAGLSLAESTGVTKVAATVIRIVRGDGTLVVEVDDPNIQVLVDGEELVITGAGPKEIRLRPGQHELHTLKDGKAIETKFLTITRDGRVVVKVAREQPTPSAPTTRQVWANAGNESGSVSPDGRDFAFIDWETSGVLTVRNLATGENRRLTTIGPYTPSPEYVDSPMFSRDGKRLAYTWYKYDGPGKWKYDLRVIGSDGGEMKSLYSNAEAYPQAYGWSPDGNSILIGLSVKAQLQLALIGATDGAVRVIKSLDGGRGKVGQISLSPDGRTIAYSRRAEPDSANRAIFLIDVESGQESRGTTNAANTDVLAWTPDGHRLLFTIERQAARDAWQMQIDDGKAQGAPQLVKADLGVVSPLGFASDGALFYGLRFARPSAFTATLDLEQETVTATPLPGESFSVKDLLSVEGWSLDGQFLAYKARTGDQRFEIRVLSLKDGQTRTLQPDLQKSLFAFHWSPDGKSFIAPGGPNGIYQIDANVGNVTTVVEPEDGTVVTEARWAPDLRGIFYAKGRNGIVYRDVHTKSEREILAPGNADFATLRFDVSPDGRQLAILGTARKSGAPILRLIPVDGGASRDLLAGEQKAGLGWVTWTPDGKGLLFTRHGPDELRGLWYIATDGGQPRRLKVSGVEERQILNIAVHPDGKQLAITTSAIRWYEVWAMENFLPLLKDTAPVTAADASAATSKTAATADRAPTGAAAREQPAPASMSTRLVWADAVDFSFSGAPSPDGKYLSHVDWASGDVGVFEVITGKSRRLTNQGWPEYGGSPIFSPDTKQVAYSWWNKDKVYELRLIGLDGSEPRVLYPNKEKVVRYLETSDWSADGNQILAFFSKKGTGETGEIVSISVVDGSVRVLKTLDWGSPGKMRLSPDGRYVAYSVPPEKTSRKRDIFLLATDGSGESSLVEHPADDFVLGWAPDGKRVVFASDRTASMGAWLIAVAEGKPLGAPELVRAEMGAFEAMGLTRSGSFYYGLFSGGQNVYTATLDLKTGKVLRPPAVAIQRGEGSNWAPAWSPDGKYLACVSWHPGKAPLFYIRSVESQAVRELTPNLGGFNVHSLQWSPDGQSLLGAGNNEGDWGALRIVVETGAVTTMVQGAGRGLFAPILAPDGQALFYKLSGNLVRRDLQSGVEQELYQTSDRAQGWTLSPDGKQLAFIESKARESAVKLLPATGGEPKELTKGEGLIGTIAWTPDGAHLLFQKMSAPGTGELWRVPAAGGEPQKLEITLPYLGHLRIHPDGRQIAFTGRSPIASTGKIQRDKTEVWVLENFLPSLGDPKAAP